MFFTKVLQVVQERAEGPKAPEAACGAYLRNLNITVITISVITVFS